MSEILWKSSDLKRWHACLNGYGEVVDRLVELQGESKADKKEENLEKWYNETFPLELGSRKGNYHLTMDEAVKLLLWKMKRGTFRPGLLKNLKERNTSAQVEKRTRDAFGALEKSTDAEEAISNAIKAVTELSYVGPGLGSAILSLYPSGIAPYMAEETVYEMPDAVGKSGKVSWTISSYVKFVSLIREKKETLNSKERHEKSKGTEAEFKWTEKKVADALWTYHFARVRQWQNKESKFGTLPIFVDPDTGGWGKWGRGRKQGDGGGSSSSNSNSKKRSNAVAEPDDKTSTNKRTKSRG